MTHAGSTSALHVESDSAERTMDIAHALSSLLQPGDIIALEGQLGAGKTQFVRGLARGLGINPHRVSSPTFVLRHEHTSTEIDRVQLVHIDAYRLMGGEDVESIGWQELLEEEMAIVAIEWPSRIGNALPAERIDVELQHMNESRRSITIRARQSLMDQLRCVLASSHQTTTTTCRTCGRTFDSQRATIPFCSDRCRMADLNRWFTESYRTSRQIEADDELEE